ncbi:MAG TPA: hypothetical protein VII94_05665, partial [Candidatus Saccharimonadales bacterium]
GKIIVSASSTNDISIQKSTITSSAPKPITGQNTLSASLKSGTYTVTVNNKSFSTQEVIQIKAHHTTRITVKLQSIGQVEPVTSSEVDNLMATPQGLTYIDQVSHGLVSVNAQNQLQTLLPGISFISIDWASSSLGIAQDQSGNLYSIVGTVVKKLSLPITPSNNNYSIAPNGEIYFSDIKSLYAGILNGNYEQMLKNDNNFLIVDASNSGLALNVGNSSDNAASSGENNNGILQLITPQGKTYSNDIEVDDAAWSPNGLDLVVTNDTSTTVYNNHLQALYKLPLGNVNSIVWLNNSTILYGVTSDLWSYNINTQTANELANVADLGYVSGIYPSQDGSYIYMSIQNSLTNSIYLTRLGLNNQPVSALMQQLQVFLPNIYEGCSIGYLDFTSPTIVIQGSGSIYENCVNVAKSYLQIYTINTSSLNFITEN